MIVGPTCTSLICAIVNPCSAGGRPVIGTSTRTTAAVRRAFRKPHSVMAPAAMGTARPLTSTSALSGTLPGSSQAASVVINRPTSRSSVSTSSDENSPRQR